MDQLSFAQQLIDDFDMEQLDIAMAPLVKQESGELATCSMAAHTGTIIQPAGTGSNSSSSSSSFMSCQPESSAPPDPSSSTTTTQQPVAVKEEFVGLDACQSKWTEASCDLKSMNFLEMCAAEILCPEAGVLGRPFADKVLTECMKSVASSEAVLSMTTLARDAAYSNSSEVLSPEASLSAEAVLSPVQALSPEALSNDAFSPDAFSPDVLSPVSENSRGGWSCSSMMMDRSDSEDASGSENSSDTVLFENSQSCSTPGGEFGLETPPDTPPDTPTPQPEEVANRRSFRGRGSAARGASASTTVDLTDQDLIHLPVRELNKRLQGCPKDQVSHLKQKRRTLKNRGYAQNCRSKRMTQKQELESTNHSLHQEIDRLKRQLASASRERDHYKRRCDILQNAVVKNCPRSGGGDQSQNGAKPPQPSGSNFQTDAAGKRL